MAHLFLIGPGGVGKTTVGPHLADLLGCRFVDLDQEFCERIEPIRGFLDRHGYPAYLQRNSELFLVLLRESTDDSIFALSSGFLVSDAEPEIQAFHRKLVRRYGMTIVLMPSSDFDRSMEIVVERQLGRGMSLQRQQQMDVFLARANTYLALGDVKIFHAGLPRAIAEEIARQLQGRWATPTIVRSTERPR